MSSRITTWLAGAALLAGAAADTAAADVPTIRWEPYVYETRTGDSISDGELGRLTVPERHDAPGGHPIELAFVRFRSTAAAPGPPIIWLAGGPSDYGTDDIEGPYLELVRAFQTVGDVIALDQRGTGLTRPRLDCPTNEELLPLDRPYDPDLAIERYRAAARHCAAHFAAEGIELSAYNSIESAHDVDAVRRALGVPRVHLYGGSYGSHLAFAVLREHPGTVDRVVVSGIEGPDHTWKLPSNIDRFFERVFALDRAGQQGTLQGASTAAGSLETMVRDALDRLAARPVTVALPGGDGSEAETITIGDFDLRLGLRAFLGSTANLAQLPAIFERLDAGDYTEIAPLMRRVRTVSVGSAMQHCMDCASGASDERLARLAAECAAEPLIGRALNFPFPEICDAWPYADLGATFRSPLACDRPTLFVSATLDGQTPPSNTHAVARGFANASFIVIDGTSHQGTELTVPELPDRLAAFLGGAAVNDTTFVVPFAFERPGSTSGE